MGIHTGVRVEALSERMQDIGCGNSLKKSFHRMRRRGQHRAEIKDIKTPEGFPGAASGVWHIERETTQ